METIIKRDGKLAEFDEAKITDAIEKASNITKEFDAKTAQQLTRNVIGIIKNFVREKQSNLKAPSIEEIQDIVEQVLLSSEYKQTAKAYILYREQHKKLRDFANNASVDMTDDYLKEIDWKVNENYNMGYSIKGLNNYIASNISKSYWLNKIYPNRVPKHLVEIENEQIKIIFEKNDKYIDNENNQKSCIDIRELE